MDFAAVFGPVVLSSVKMSIRGIRNIKIVHICHTLFSQMHRNVMLSCTHASFESATNF